MEVKPGYKSTEMGVIPEDWITATLEGAVRSGGLVRGPFGGALKKEMFVDGGYKVYEQRNAIYGSVEQGDYYIDSGKFRELDRFRVESGDFIVSCSGTIGCIYQIPVGSPEGVINQALLKISLDQKRIDARFFLAVFRSASFQERIKENSHGGAMQNLVGMEVFRKTPFQLPPTKVEQEAIAEALSDADALIESLGQLLAKKRQLKQGAMQELLTGKKRLPGFERKHGYKQTEAGVIPKDWEAMPFIRAVRSYIDYRGRTPRKLGMSWGGGDILALSANNVQMGRIDPDKEAYFGNDELYRKWMVQGECESGDVLLTMEAPLGNVAQILDSKKYILSQRVLLIKPKDWLSRDFLAYYMKGSVFQNQLSLNSTGTTAKGIQRRKLDELPVGLPPVQPEQTAIAAVLSDMDAEIAVLEAKLAKARRLKQGMMQELLTGRIRLV